MCHAESVSHWIEQLREGSDHAAQEIWNRYFKKLVAFAQKKLHGMPRRIADEEDIALSAFNSFCQGVEQGRFPRLDDRHDLWKVLVTITARKAAAQRRYSKRGKRGGGEVRGESVFKADSSAGQGIDQFQGLDPTPEFAAQVAEEYNVMLELLGDESLRQVAIMKLENYTNIEIAEQLGCVPRTVDRKLRRIRELWERAEKNG